MILRYLNYDSLIDPNDALIYDRCVLCGDAMRKRIFTWLGKEFVELSGEAKPSANATIEAQELFQGINRELQQHDLSLDNTVRSRLWGRDRQSRDLGSNERVKTL